MKTYQKFLITLLCAWIAFAFLRTVYDVSKVFTEERVWLQLSDIQQREKLYGDVYTFAVFVDQYSNKSDTIALLSNDGQSYFYSRYYLYPKKIYLIHSLKDIGQNRFAKLAVFHPQDFSSFVFLTTPEATLSGQTNTIVGQIYKLP